MVAELFDPATGEWSLTGSIITPRSGHTSTLLANGSVLAVGGQENGNVRDTAEVYDVSSETWSLAGRLNAPHSGHTATLLPNGKVLVAAGGYRTAELYESSAAPPGTNSFRMTAMFSDQAGLYQYLQLQELSGLNDQNHLPASRWSPDQARVL